jgi:hypothetical protein
LGLSLTEGKSMPSSFLTASGAAFGTSFGAAFRTSLALLDVLRHLLRKGRFFPAQMI